ncbi:MAG: DUF4348 domain-containing protein [Bacteroides sp.]|nr:DUF4348 domain-containing protein [Bacteroides sp.]
MDLKKYILLCLLAAFSVCSVRGQAVQPEDFTAFLDRFTTSAAFQYERVRFPLASSIVLLDDDGETEHTYPFTREKWALLDIEMLTPDHVEMEDGSVFVARYLTDEPDRKEFEAGYEESELILRVIFDRVEGEWYVTDGYFSWYGYDLPPAELAQTIAGIVEDNEIFEEAYP